ncbi:unnamed protein product [Parascedosporium putredinis]|uniref:Carboxymuconolactone decarboxylase-like domain-containing protein n=1 Tax=Parascedosporium putredinis TaxID=1442378 RepID=A0A9P1H361_9PEZI|nr:unnamed protein product [Parascedosporium putredinis]CAI7995514.1 unnamed protein product [Parascedosporium putredinis]
MPPFRFSPILQTDGTTHTHLTPEILRDSPYSQNASPLRPRPRSHQDGGRGGHRGPRASPPGPATPPAPRPYPLALPSVADGWNSFLGAVRTRTSIAEDIKELAISRVAVCNRAWYEWGHHAPLAVKAGVSEAVMEIAKGPDPLQRDQKPESVGEKEWAVLVYTDEMTRNVEVADETFALVKGLFNEQEVVEITATIACYNCVSRFLVALDVGERNGLGPDGAAH